MGERKANGDGSARVTFQFIRDLPLFLDEKPYSVVRTKELPDDESTNIVYEECDVTDMLQDIRGREGDFTLDKNSLCWLNHPSKIDITTEEDMMVPYAKEVNNLLRKIFKTEDVICYDLRWRRNSIFTDEEAFSNSRSVPSPPVRTVHVDHTVEGGWNRIYRHMSSNETQKFCSGDYRARIVNVWRPLFCPIEDSPIAFCDPATIESKDMLEVDRVTPISLIEIFQVKFNAAQKWYWLSNQTPDEVSVFVQFDSHPPENKLNFIPHVSFIDPNTRPGAKPRQSVETRSIVFTKL